MTSESAKSDLKRRKIPERTCIACRTHSNKGDLVRVVRGADGMIRPDPSGKQPGRGAYICPKAECIAKALKEKRFDRALRAHIPPTLVGDLESALCVFGESKE